MTAPEELTLERVAIIREAYLGLLERKQIGPASYREDVAARPPEELVRDLLFILAESPPGRSRERFRKAIGA